MVTQTKIRALGFSSPPPRDQNGSKGFDREKEPPFSQQSLRGKRRPDSVVEWISTLTLPPTGSVDVDSAVHLGSHRPPAATTGVEWDEGWEVLVPTVPVGAPALPLNPPPPRDHLRAPWQKKIMDIFSTCGHEIDVPSFEVLFGPMQKYRFIQFMVFYVTSILL